MSGLDINLEKTRAVWIGSMCKSSKTMCKQFNLDWEQRPIKILGVIFTAEVFDIWDQNSDIILEKINSMIKTWSRRKLILIGRVTIIKSLTLSKFAYLFLALPNPPGSLVKSLEKMLFEFLWNKGPDRISRMQIVKNIEAGGLRMTNVKACITSLKVTWLRRIITNSNNNNWSTLSNINFNSLCSLGDTYFRFLSKDLDNPFWKDVLESLYKYYSSSKIQNLDDILSSPIWCNSHVSNTDNFLYKHWFNKGIRTVNDLIDSNGNIYTFEGLKEIHEIRGTYLDFEAVIRKISRAWLEKINANTDICINLKYYVLINPYIEIYFERQERL